MDPRPSPQDRATNVQKIREFLYSIVTPGPESHVKSLDIATRFEEQAFLSTKSREEYIMFIRGKLKALQQKMLQSQRMFSNHPSNVPASSSLSSHPYSLSHSSSSLSTLSESSLPSQSSISMDLGSSLKREFNNKAFNSNSSLLSPSNLIIKEKEYLKKKQFPKIIKSYTEELEFLKNGNYISEYFVDDLGIIVMKTFNNDTITMDDNLILLDNPIIGCKSCKNNKDFNDRNIIGFIRHYRFHALVPLPPSS